MLQEVVGRPSRHLRQRPATVMSHSSTMEGTYCCRRQQAPWVLAGICVSTVVNCDEKESFSKQSFSKQGSAARATHARQRRQKSSRTPCLWFASSWRGLKLEEALPHALVHLHYCCHVACSNETGLTGAPDRHDRAIASTLHVTSRMTSDKDPRSQHGWGPHYPVTGLHSGSKYQRAGHNQQSGQHRSPKNSESKRPQHALHKQA